jgi:hypothetical protein
MEEQRLRLLADKVRHAGERVRQRIGLPQARQHDVLVLLGQRIRSKLSEGRDRQQRVLQVFEDAEEKSAEPVQQPACAAPAERGANKARGERFRRATKAQPSVKARSLQTECDSLLMHLDTTDSRLKSPLREAFNGTCLTTGSRFNESSIVLVSCMSRWCWRLARLDWE